LPKSDNLPNTLTAGDIQAQQNVTSSGDQLNEKKAFSKLGNAPRGIEATRVRTKIFI